MHFVTFSTHNVLTVNIYQVRCIISWKDKITIARKQNI